MINQIKHIIADGKSFLITTHIDPDGDAVGSVFSLYWVLKYLGKETQVYLRDEVPYRYQFLPGPEHVVHELPMRMYDALFVLDCGNLFRTGDGYEKIMGMGTIVSIDHHETNDFFGAVNYVDAGASSTGELLYRLYKSMNIPLSGDIAVNLYTAVFTDTGSLRYDNSSPVAYDICREMVEAGVKPASVSQMVYESHPKERFLLLGEVLGTIQTLDGGKVAIAHVTDDMFKKTGTKREHTDGFSEYIREIKGVEVAIFMRQTGKKRYKISMRSKGTVDVARICSGFGGGGHRNAAGCSIDGDISDVKEQLEAVFQK